MKKRGRVDANQSEIVKALRQIGASVYITSQLGGGFPDIVVGFRGKNYLFEIKDGSKKASARRLTTDEADFIGGWAGAVWVVYSEEDAINIIKKT